MVGRDVQLTVDRGESTPAGVMLKAEDLRVADDRGHEVVHGVSFEVRAGEIFGIAGVAGNGQDELVEAIMGLRRKTTSGKVTLDEPRRDHGVAARPARRRRRASSRPIAIGTAWCCRSRSPTTSCSMTIRTRHTRRGLVRDDATPSAARAQECVTEFDVRTHSVLVNAGTLSGGNQQKVVVARELGRDPKLLVLDQPTRGLDVGSIEFIHRETIERRTAGTAVLLISAELDEVLELSDRIGDHVSRRVRRGRRRATGRQGGDRPAHGDRRTGLASTRRRA